MLKNILLVAFTINAISGWYVIKSYAEINDDLRLTNSNMYELCIEKGPKPDMDDKY